LSAIYLNHRESEDLDFFTPYDLPSQFIGSMIAAIAKELGWIGVSRDLKYPVNIYVLKWDDGSSLKLDFNYYAFKRIKKGGEIFGISVDSLEDIAANKLDTLFSRTKARDYVDIFSIVKSGKLSFLEILQLHRKKFEIEIDNLTISKVLLRSTEAIDYPVMKVKFDKKEMINFFENEAKKLESKIFKK
jgi:hypothetical protein